MRSASLVTLLSPIDRLYAEIIEFVPQDTQRLQFRSDLAGLLVVSMAAAYENCVKDVLVAYCGSHSPVFGAFAEKQYEKLNSRVNSGDLYGYAKLFGSQVHKAFSDSLSAKRDAILSRTGQDIVGIYDQILRWRHQYAHAGQQNTTVEEAYVAHRFGKRVLFAFAEVIK